MNKLGHILDVMSHVVVEILCLIIMNCSFYVLYMIGNWLYCVIINIYIKGNILY